MSSQAPISVIISYKSVQHPISLLPSETLATLQARLEELTTVPLPRQKLLYKGKKGKASDTQTLEEAGLRDGTKVMLLGSTEQEVDGMKAAEAQKHKRDTIMQQRAARGPTKVRSTATPSRDAMTYIFHRLEPLPHLPAPETALALLKRLAADPAISHVMRTHQFAIGLLTELAPHEHPNLLGLNMNKGQEIKLRLRTNTYDGFRNYRDVRRVLCHELTHCVWGDHGDNFKTLNSQLNREVAEFEQATAEGSHALDGGDVYEPEVEAEAHARLVGGSYVLGGGAPAGEPVDSREERRRRILEATTSRLRREEQVIEDMCGSVKPTTQN